MKIIDSMHVTKKPHKQVGNQILYLADEVTNKWLVRETLKTEKKAKNRFKKIKEEKQIKV